MADAVTQLLTAARRVAQQARSLAVVEDDTRGVAEAELADAALADAIDARVLHPIVPDFTEFREERGAFDADGNWRPVLDDAYFGDRP